MVILDFAVQWILCLDVFGSWGDNPAPSGASGEFAFVFGARQMGWGAPGSVLTCISRGQSSKTWVPPVSLCGGFWIPCHVGPCLAVLSPLQSLSPYHDTPAGQGFWVGRQPFSASSGSGKSGLADYTAKSARISVRASKDVENACFVPHLLFSGSPLWHWNRCPFCGKVLCPPAPRRTPRCSGDSAGPCRALLDMRTS